jgi:hydroxylamine reductase
MFCRQCEQTSQNYACTSVGVCGKTPETSSVQDSLNFVVQSVSQWAVAAQQHSDASAEVKEFLEEVNLWTLHSLFATMTVSTGTLQHLWLWWLCVVVWY